MGDFTTEAALGQFLGTIAPMYRRYATCLWDAEIRSPGELANVSVNVLVSLGVSVAHAEVIQNSINTAGAV